MMEYSKGWLVIALLGDSKNAQAIDDYTPLDGG